MTVEWWKAVLTKSEKDFFNARSNLLSAARRAGVDVSQFLAGTALISRDEAYRGELAALERAARAVETAHIDPSSEALAMSAWLDTVTEARALAKRCAKKTEADNNDENDETGDPDDPDNEADDSPTEPTDAEKKRRKAAEKKRKEAEDAGDNARDAATARAIIEAGRKRRGEVPSAHDVPRRKPALTVVPPGTKPPAGDEAARDAATARAILNAGCKRRGEPEKF
jgi:hypothetical protein